MAKTRNGKPLKVRPQPARLCDGRNAWRHLTPENRCKFLAWIAEEDLEGTPPGLREALLDAADVIAKHHGTPEAVAAIARLRRR